jgi:hypothetical protein
LRGRIGSTFVVIAVAVGLMSTVAGPIYSALDSSPPGSSSVSLPGGGVIRPNRII